MIGIVILLVLCSVSVLAAPSNSSIGVVPLERSHPEFIPILAQSEDLEANGTYTFSYETGNGIKREEKAFDKVLPPVARSAHHSGDGDEDADNSEIHVQQGSYSYTAPDGTIISLRYVADENGFQPQGEHLPKAPTVGNSEEEKSTNSAATKTQDKPDNISAASEPKETKTAVPSLLSRSAIDNNDSGATKTNTKTEDEDNKSESTANTESTVNTESTESDLLSTTEVSETPTDTETSENITTDTNDHELTNKPEVTTQDSNEEISTTDSAKESESLTTEVTSTAAST